MKKILIWLIATLGVQAVGTAQTFTLCNPIVKDSKQWVYYMRYKVMDGYVYTPVVYELKGDTTIGNHQYLKLYRDAYFYDKKTEEIKHTRTVCAYMREHLNKVYVRERGRFYKMPLYGWVTAPDFRESDIGYEYLIYLQGDINCFDQIALTVREREIYFSFTAEKQIEYNGCKRYCYTTNDPYRMMIEGVGYVQTNWGSGPHPVVFSNFYNLNPIQFNAPEWFPNGVLSHVIEHGEIIFKGELYDYFKENAYDPDKPVGENVAVEDLPVDTPADGSGPLYDLQGRVVTNPAPGIYVRNGQKVVVE